LFNHVVLLSWQPDQPPSPRAGLYKDFLERVGLKTSPLARKSQDRAHLVPQHSIGRDSLLSPPICQSDLASRIQRIFAGWRLLYGWPPLVAIVVEIPAFGGEVVRDIVTRLPQTKSLSLKTGNRVLHNIHITHMPHMPDPNPGSAHHTKRKTTRDPLPQLKRPTPNLTTHHPSHPPPPHSTHV
jgi:hypothetical protein